LDASARFALRPISQAADPARALAALVAELR